MTTSSERSDTRKVLDSLVSIDLWVHRERFPRGHPTIPWPTVTGRGWLASHCCGWDSELFAWPEEAWFAGMAHRFDCDPSLPDVVPEGRLF